MNHEMKFFTTTFEILEMENLIIIDRIKILPNSSYSIYTVFNEAISAIKNMHLETSSQIVTL